MQYAGETDIVANLYVKNVTMRYAENGARIKVFGGSPDASAYRYLSGYSSRLQALMSWCFRQYSRRRYGIREKCDV